MEAQRRLEEKKNRKKPILAVTGGQIQTPDNSSYADHSVQDVMQQDAVVVPKSVVATTVSNNRTP